MHGDVDAAGEQRFLEFLGEQALAAGFRKRTILDAVAGRGDRLDRKGLFRQIMRGHQPGPRLVRLRQGKWAAAASNPQHGCLHGTVRDTPRF